MINSDIQSIVRPMVGVAIIIEREGRVLLLQRHRSHGSGTWATPGGHLDFGEAPEQCAIREAQEETGLEVTEVSFRTITNDVFVAEGKHYITIWMEARAYSGEPIVNAPDEASAIGWFAWDALPQPLFLPVENLLAGGFVPNRR